MSSLYASSPVTAPVRLAATAEQRGSVYNVCDSNAFSVIENSDKLLGHAVEQKEALAGDSESIIDELDQPA